MYNIRYIGKIRGLRRSVGERGGQPGPTVNSCQLPSPKIRTESISTKSGPSLPTAPPPLPPNQPNNMTVQKSYACALQPPGGGGGSGLPPTPSPVPTHPYAGGGGEVKNNGFQKMRSFSPKEKPAKIFSPFHFFRNSSL
jgi:hypothetical protein